MLVERSLELPIEKRYSISAIADAHQHVEGGHKRGNLVIETIESDEQAWQ